MSINSPIYNANSSLWTFHTYNISFEFCLNLQFNPNLSFLADENIRIKSMIP